VGETSDLKRRIEWHNNHEFKNASTVLRQTPKLQDSYLTNTTKRKFTPKLKTKNN